MNELEKTRGLLGSAQQLRGPNATCQSGHMSLGKMGQFSQKTAIAVSCRLWENQGTHVSLGIIYSM